MQVVDRDIKESLNLGSVQVNGYQPVNLVHFQQVGNQFGGNWFPTPGLAILPSITIVGHHHVNFGRTSPPQCIHHD